MKTKYWIVLFILILAVCAVCCVVFFRGSSGAMAEISSDGEVICTVDLRIDQEMQIESENGGTNLVAVENGQIRVKEASCPDQVCVDRGYCSGGAPVVCLPNRLVITFLGESELDASTG